VNQGGSVNGETLALGKLADVTAASVEDNSLAPREFMLARMAALIQVDAPPAYSPILRPAVFRKRGDSGA